MDKQREDFEAWLRLDGYDHHSFEISAFNEENYHNDWVQFAWSAWQQAQKVAVPDGYKLVPIEPTQSMIDKFPDVFYQDTYMGECSMFVDDETIEQGWKAMLEA